MSNSKEIGALSFIEAWSTLVTEVQSLDCCYNPKSDRLKPENLQENLHRAKAILADIEMASMANLNAIAAKQAANDGLPKFMVRVVNAFDSSKADLMIKSHVKSICARFQPGNKPVVVTSKKAALVVVGNGEASAILPTRVHSHILYDNKVIYLRQVIFLLEREPTYSPIKPEHSISGLYTLAIELDYHNKRVIETENALAIARNRRDTFFYNQNSGLVAKWEEINAYVKLLYGATSDEAMRISAIRLDRFS